MSDGGSRSAKRPRATADSSDADADAGPAPHSVAGPAVAGVAHLPDFLAGVGVFFYKVDADEQRQLSRLIKGYGGYGRAPVSEHVRAQ